MVSAELRPYRDLLRTWLRPVQNRVWAKDFISRVLEKYLPGRTPAAAARCETCQRVRRVLSPAFRRATEVASSSGLQGERGRSHARRYTEDRETQCGMSGGAHGSAGPCGHPCRESLTGSLQPANDGIGRLLS